MAFLRCEKRFQAPLQPNLISLCPRLDLVAMVSSETQLEVYRFSGQRAFAHSRLNASEGRIEGMVWQPDGMLPLK